MGAGLKKVAKLCGGITAKSNGKTVKYNKNGKVIRTPVKVETPSQEIPDG